jgi:hypothetical protein
MIIHVPAMEGYIVVFSPSMINDTPIRIRAEVSFLRVGKYGRVCASSSVPAIDKLLTNTHNRRG